MGMNWLFKPTIQPGKRLAEAYGQHINPPNEEGNMLRGFMQGAAEGAGGVIDDMSSPFSLMMTAAGMPWLKSAGRGLSSLSGIGRTAKGVSPAVLPAQLVERGGEGLYNASKSAAPIAKTVEDLAYEVVRRGNDTINKQIGGGFNLAEAMRRSNSARGK